MINKIMKTKTSIMTCFFVIMFLTISVIHANATTTTTTIAAPTVTIYSNGGYTNNQYPQIYVKTGAYEYVTINIDSKDMTDVRQADAYGNWYYTPVTPLSEGSHSIKAKVADSSGNTSAYSEVAKVNIDLTAPPAPTIDPSLNNLITKNTRPIIFGTSDPNAVITLNIDGTDTDVVIADSKGKWTSTTTVPLSPDIHYITAKARDQAGNVGLASSITSITIDTTPPATPVIVKPNDAAIFNTNKPQVISGTSEPNATISIKIDGAELVDVAKADVYGMWSFTPKIVYNEGTHTLLVRQKDVAGNLSDYSASRQFTIDTVAPDPPIITQPLGDIITNNQRPQIIGTSEANATLIVNVDGKDVMGLSPADSLGNWSYTPTENLNDGTHKFIIKVSDAAGNISGTKSFNISVDSIKPDMPVILTPIQDATLLPKVTMTGKGEKNDTIMLRVDSTPVNDTINIDKTGNWKYTFNTNLSVGAHTVFASVKDAAGNISDETEVDIKTVAAFPVVKPVIKRPLDNALLNNSKPTISGTAEPGAKVILSSNGKDFFDPITADSDGNWRVILSRPFAEGDNELDIRAVSALYKTETKGESINITIDTIAPEIPAIDSPTNKKVIVGNQLFISGMGEPGSTIVAMVDNKQGTTYTYRTKASELGSWSIKPSTKFATGNYLIAVQAKDNAGNSSKLSPFTSITFKKKVVPVTNKKSKK